MQINLKTSFGIDDTLHVPRVFCHKSLYMVNVLVVGNNNNREREKKKLSFCRMPNGVAILHIWW